MRRKPARSQWPRRITVSPSSRKRARLAVGQRAAAACRPAVSSSSEPACSRRRPRQRARAEQVAAAQVAAVDGVVRDQLRHASSSGVGEVRAASGARPHGRPRASPRSAARPRARCRTRRARGCPASRDRAAAAGSPAGAVERRCGTAPAPPASRSTATPCVAKFFDRNGPSGWYSQAWMSRALQSLNSVEAEDVLLGARRSAIGSPSAFGRPMKMPSSSS